MIQSLTARLKLALPVVIMLLATAAPIGAVEDPHSVDWKGTGSDNQFVVGASGTNQTYRPAPVASQSDRTGAGSSASSSGSQWIPTGPLCPDGASDVLIGCEQALAIAGILGGTSSLPATAGGSGAAPAVDPATLITISDIQSIVADGGTITVSPNRGWVYVNKPVYFESDAVAYTENLTILGNTVAVHLSPQSYTWDPGDGSGQFASNNRGGPWPNGTVTHAYLKDAKSVRIDLTVTWSASFTVAGTTYPVVGTATSTTQSDPFEVREADAVLTN